MCRYQAESPLKRRFAEVCLSSAPKQYYAMSNPPLDDPCRLMPQRERLPHRPSAHPARLPEVDIRAADADGVHTEKDLAGARIGDRRILQPDVALAVKEKRQVVVASHVWGGMASQVWPREQALIF